MTLAGYWQMRRYELEHRPLRPKYLYASSSTGAEGMLGKQAIVRAECAPEGTVRVRNELWRARALDSASLPVGATVIVREVDGLCLLVESVSPNENRTDG
jgi:membrane protein implicated in regulation of membrane protease activity